MKANLNKLEKLGRLRFPSGAEFEKYISERSSDSVNLMLENLADNYPKVDSSRIASVYRAFCEERERALKSMGDIADDQFYNDTRPEYLFQILGDMLFINEKASGAQYTDKTYREFLLNVKDAYLNGSTADNINNSLSEIIGLPVVLRQLYLDARKSGSGLTIKDTHKLVADLFLSEGTTEELQHLSIIIQDLYFFIKLIKPAHTLFDTRLIWEESMPVAGCPADSFAMDQNGTILQYQFTDTDHDIYSLFRLVVTDDSESEIVGENWVEGVVAPLGIDDDGVAITLVGGSELVVNSMSSFYKDFDDGTHRMGIEGLAPGDHLWFFGGLAPGSFNFYDTPTAVGANPLKQYDPMVIFSAEFQSKVIVEKDSTGNVLIEQKCEYALADTQKSYVLKALYEDLRDNCAYPSPKLYNEIFMTPGSPTTSEGDGYAEYSGYVNISDETNNISISQIPLSAEKSGLATVSDVTIYVDNIRIEDGVARVDPWEGLVTLNFLPPAGSALRVDYWFQGIYPVLTSSKEFVAPEATVPVPGAITLRFNWPFPIASYDAPQTQDPLPLPEGATPEEAEAYKFEEAGTNYSCYGDSKSYQLNDFPILKYNGDLAAKEDIIVYVNGNLTSDAIDFIRPLLGHIQLSIDVTPGDIVYFDYYYQASLRNYPLMTDSSQHLTDLIFGRNSYSNLVSDPNGEFIRAAGLPPVIEPQEGDALPLPENATPEEVEAYLFSTAGTPVIGDPNNLDDGTRNQDSGKIVATYGYRYDALDTGYSSVWNSEDTFKLNDYEMVDGVSNYETTPSKFNRFKLHFSGEYHEDTSKYVELNSEYKFNDLEALIQLKAGTPPFYRTFTSWANYIYQTPTTASTYTEGVDGQLDLAAQVTIDSEPSGLIEHVPLEELLTRKRFKYLADTQEAITVEGDESLSLSTICDDRYMGLKVAFEEEYYPNRELRLNDYRDYLRKSSTGYKEGTLSAVNGGSIFSFHDDHGFTLGTVEIIVVEGTEYKVVRVIDNMTVEVDQVFAGVTNTNLSYVVPSVQTGALQALTGSNILKSVDVNWRILRKGAIFSIRETENGSVIDTFTIAGVIDQQTARISKPFNLASGKYYYSLSMPVVERTDVLLNNVVRKLEFDLSNFSGMTGIMLLNFPDPDLDPYPRNDDAFGAIANPLLTSEVNGPEGEYDQGSRTKYLQDRDVAAKLVKYRNWDQELMIVNFGRFLDTIEDPLSDDAQDIKFFFYNPNSSEYVTYTFQGMLLITYEGDTVVNVGDYPNALIRVESPSDATGLGDGQYTLRSMVVRQVLADNSVDTVTIEEFAPIA